jgi:hypothetical protein
VNCLGRAANGIAAAALLVAALAAAAQVPWYAVAGFAAVAGGTVLLGQSAKARAARDCGQADETGRPEDEQATLEETETIR